MTSSTPSTPADLTDVLDVLSFLLAEHAAMRAELAAIREAVETKPRDPQPIATDRLILVGEAARIARRHEKTIRRWCARHGLGTRTPAGRLYVSSKLLDDFLRGRS